MKGYYQTNMPGVEILRGWNPQEPTTLATSHPIAINTETGKPEKILSGMVISTNAAGTAWLRGVEATATAAQLNTIAIAQDHATTWDVIDADNTNAFYPVMDGASAAQPYLPKVGSLVGLSCSGKFRIASPYFARYYKDGAEVKAFQYTSGTPLAPVLPDEEIWTAVPDLENPGNLKVVKVADPTGYFRPAKAGDEVVLGVVSDTHNGANREDTNHGSAVPANGALSAMALQKSIGRAVSSESVWYNAYFVVFDTNLVPVVAAAGSAS